MQHDIERADPGRAAYEARFAHARPRDVEPWDSLTPEVKAIWAHVEAKSRGQVVAPDEVREALTEAIREGLSESSAWASSEPDQIADALIAGPLANVIVSAAESDRWGSEYADAMDARMADAITMERIGAALAVFARMNAMDPPEAVRLNDWLPAITGARTALKEAGLQRLLDPASGTPESEARSRA